MKLNTALVRYMLVAAIAISTTSYGAAQLELPGTVCVTFELCHNSAGLAYTSVDLFAALEPLFKDLKLGAVNEYIDLTSLQSSAAGCSCSTPVRVHLSIPVSEGQTASAVQVQVAAFLKQHLPYALANVACLGEPERVQCNVDDIAVARRRLGEMEIELAPEPVAAPAAPAHSDSSNGGAYGSYGSYGSGEYSAYGGYEGAGYGGYAAEPAIELEDKASTGAPVARNLMAQPGQAAAAAKPSFLISARQTANYSLTCPPCPACAVDKVEPAAATGMAGGASCYCRFNELASSWALSEPICRAALYRKCGSAAGLLDCDHVDEHYAAYSSANAAGAPHTADINAFLFVDCPPAAPCSCVGLRLDGQDQLGLARMNQCCSDLRAHCQVPFSGLSCLEVEQVCAGDAAASASVATFVKVKTHKAGCSSSVATKAYRTITGAGLTSADAAAALLEGAPAARAHKAAQLVLVMVVAGAVAIAAAVAGMVALWQHFTFKQYTTPLLSSGY